MFARIAVNIPTLSEPFDYHIPPELTSAISTGCLVRVPFGAQTVQGVVLRLVEQPAVSETKAILDLVDPEPVLTSEQIALAESLAEQYLTPLSAMIGLLLPSGLSQQADVLYSLADQKPIADLGRIAQRLLGILEKRGPLRARQIDTHFRQVAWRKSAEWLVKHGVLSKNSVLPTPRLRPKYIRVAQLAAPLEAAEEALPDLGRTKATKKRRAKALRFLMRELEEVNVSWVYAESGCNLSDLQELAKRDLIVLRENEIWRDPLDNIESKPITEGKFPVLTAHQKKAWQELAAGYDQLSAGNSIRPFLLHGVTGSGKTELYLRAATETVRRGRQAVILVPEIALTPQTVRRFLARFPGQVGLMHSKLSTGERYDTWRRARTGTLKVIIGARSALFAPLPDIGLIVLDECHDSSYYQSEPPFYHTETAAKTYARLTGALCILGSATPTVTQRWQAEVGESALLELPQRIRKAGSMESAPGLPPVSIVDMREELKRGNREIFSRLLRDSLQETLKRGEQAILFLNRRGTATYIFCRECGYVLKCPQCEMPLTFHVYERERLVCHHCGYRRQKPVKCPACRSMQIREYGLGSERVEAEVGKLFPQARVLRWDWETTRQKEAHEIILSHFAAHRADVLVGTQMLAKGLDLPLVTLVGVVLAEVGLNLPDPFAAERVFQVLTQVAGRAGRSRRGGQVILQTFEPDQSTIQDASRHDYRSFYSTELAGRRTLGYPPFGELVRLEYRHRDGAAAKAEAKKLGKRLARWIRSQERHQTHVIGPAPCFYAKLRGDYRWQIMLRGPNPVEILRGQRFEGWRVEVNPISLL